MADHTLYQYVEELEEKYKSLDMPVLLALLEQEFARRKKEARKNDFRSKEGTALPTYHRTRAKML